MGKAPKMSYYFATELDLPYDEAVAHVTDTLKADGFGVLTQIDVKATLEQKLDADFRPYVILGACNPPLAHKALLAEEWIGLMLPCNVVVQQTDDGTTRVGAIDPAAAMSSVDNPALEEIAGGVRKRLRGVIEAL
jgi:uncharacterized protein (DUF302 family)